MSRKIILNLAISLDGCICDEDGGYSWIKGHNDKTQDTEKQFNFTEFFNRVDIVVMGRKAYDDCGIKSIDNYEQKQFYVVTSAQQEDLPNVTFISGDFVQQIIKLTETDGKDIWLFGGSKLTDEFVKANVVDEYIIGILPIIVGKGIKLFNDLYPEILLHLHEATVSDGIIIMNYTRRS